ncbi:hypothetical protein C8J57DRAFT_1125785 [Mycena rebaudengoi]|nr:hypothetical protein C8J57DRAFT_1125785 [Mycena rebaudengoi]
MFSNAVSQLKLKLKSSYNRITLNRVTTTFVLLSFIHCFAQGIIQSFLFSLNTQFAGLVTEIVHAAHIPQSNMTYLERSGNQLHLRMCDDIPHGQSRYPCMDIFQSGVDVQNDPFEAGLAALKSATILQALTAGFSLTTEFDDQKNVTGVTLHSTGSQAGDIFLSKQCTEILVYPQQNFKNAVREDITMIVLQFWLLAVSVFAVAQSSVPHTLTALGTRILITAWSAYLIWRSLDQKARYSALISAPGTPCGVEMFPTYFAMRQAYDIADLILSGTSLLLSGLLSWNLLKVYNAQSFKRVGAPAHITRIYKFFTAVQACLQLEVFVLVAAEAVWLDVLVNTAISKFSAHTVIYDGLIILTTILLLPWITLGWFAVARENKWMMVGFLGIAFFYIAGWSLMFYSIVYRWSFVEWPFLGCLTIASFVLIISSAVLGAICWKNFNKGLAQYLHAEAALASSDFSPEVFDHEQGGDDGIEKSGFYDSLYEVPERPMPTFEAPTKRLQADGGILGAIAQNNSGAPTPVRGPPPTYNKPYNGSSNAF